MAKTKRHLCAKIENLLQNDDDWLGRIFEGDGSETRQDLENRFKNGEILIGSEGCDGFDPITGCPGHEV